MESNEVFRTAKGKKFHTPGCGCTRRGGVPKANLTSSTVAEAIAAGATACATCCKGLALPTPEAKVYCAGSGAVPANGLRLYMECPCCGKTMRVMRGGIRKHK